MLLWYTVWVVELDVYVARVVCMDFCVWDIGQGDPQKRRTFPEYLGPELFIASNVYAHNTQSFLIFGRTE